jgi:hypothetical protein
MYTDPVNPMHFVGSCSNSLGQQNSMSNMKSNICRKEQLHIYLHKIIQQDPGTRTMPTILVISQSKTSRKFISSIWIWETYVWNLQTTCLTKGSCWSYLNVAAISSTKTGEQFCMADAKKVFVFSRPTKNNTCSKKPLTPKIRSNKIHNPRIRV